MSPILGPSIAPSSAIRNLSADCSEAHNAISEDGPKAPEYCRGTLLVLRDRQALVDAANHGCPLCLRRSFNLGAKLRDRAVYLYTILGDSCHKLVCCAGFGKGGNVSAGRSAIFRHAFCSL